KRNGQPEVASWAVVWRVAVEVLLNIECPVHVERQVAANLAIELQTRALTGQIDEQFGCGGRVCLAGRAETVARRARKDFGRILEGVEVLIVLPVVGETAFDQKDPVVCLKQPAADAAPEHQSGVELERLVLLNARIGDGEPAV